MAKSLFLALLLGSSAVIASPAAAVVTVFDSDAAFTSSTITTTYDFAGTDPNNSFTSYNSLTVGPATFTPGPGSILFSISSFVNPYGQTFLSSQFGVPSLLTSLTGSLTAFAFDFGGYAPTGSQQLFVSVNGGPEVQRAVPAFGATAFLGFTSTDPISSVAFRAIDGITIDLTSFRAGAIAAVPEPATWAMMIGGFGAIGGSLRVRRRKVTFATA